MEHKNNILNELQLLSPLLAGIEKTNIFSVPEGYFEKLSDELVMLANAGNGSVLQSINKLSVNNVPAGYFDTLSDNILNKIKLQPENATEEIKNISPVLYALQSIHTFETPSGYFDTLSNDILNKLPSQPVTKVIPIRKYNSWLKYAVAAVVTGIMALGIFKFTQNNNNISDKTPLPQYVLDGKKIQNIDEELAKIDEADIVKYLQANGEGIDPALLTNTTVGAGLPSEEDYLFNENALNNYLLDNIDENSFKN